MVNHVSKMESQFTKLDAVGSLVDDLMKVTLLISSPNQKTLFEPAIVFVYTYSQDAATRQYATHILVEEQKRENDKNVSNNTEISEDVGK